MRSPRRWQTNQNAILGSVANQKWTAHRVFGIVISNSGEARPMKNPQALSAFCREHDISESAVLQKLFAGYLGDAQLRDDEFWIEPTQSELHFPGGYASAGGTIRSGPLSCNGRSRAFSAYPSERLQQEAPGSELRLRNNHPTGCPRSHWPRLLGMRGPSAV